MLVLSRRQGERIRIATEAGDIYLTVVEIRADKVRIGIDAPRSMNILREEVDREHEYPHLPDHECSR